MACLTRSPFAPQGHSKRPTRFECARAETFGSKKMAALTYSLTTPQARALGDLWQQEDGVCDKCPVGTSTNTPGADTVALCKEPCAAGSVGIGGFQPCTLCLPGEFGPVAGSHECLRATVCESCPVDVSAVDAAAARGEILEPLPTLLTIATGITTADECFKLCDPAASTDLRVGSL
ncbi:hypothetical protein T484DRAFT_1777829 [Baffinella frigidus]|nr:hypothetical protein T484DRAFT_1777829 [Cryptophyta sp. CCMP2293]